MHPNTNVRGHNRNGMNHSNSQKNDSNKSSAILPVLTSFRAPEVSGYQHTKRVGSYMVGKLLGEGSFAKVREALHMIVGEKVAVKIIDKKAARMDFYVNKHLRREAAILQQLSHPNIVSLLEVLETDNNLYLVLEICNGGPLLDLIWNQQGLSEMESKKFTRQVISAVQHLHNMGVMHRDLKVENLLLDEDHNIKLIDFGLSSYHVPTCEVLPTGAVQSASSIYDRNMTATLCGSPAYAAPEIISQKSYGPKVDVWSIGVNTFAMLTATLPFLVEPFNLRLLLRKMLTADMTELPERVSTECREFVSYLLQPDPSSRPTIHQAARHPWLIKDSDSTPSPPLRRISSTELEPGIIYEIRETTGIDPSHVIESVVGRRADEFAALYSLMHMRKQRLWRMNICDVRSSFDKLKMELDEDGDAIEASVQRIIDFTNTMEMNRKTSGSRESQTSMRLNQHEDSKGIKGQNFHQIYHDVLYEDEENSGSLASNSQRKLRMDARKISEMCQRSNATSVASGNPWVGLMGREKSFVGVECAVYNPELVESFKVNEKQKNRVRRNVPSGTVKTKGNQVKGQTNVTTKRRPQAPVGQVAPVIGVGKRPAIQLSTLGHSKPVTNKKAGKLMRDGNHSSMDSLRWNGDILKSKSKTNIIDKRKLHVKKTSVNRNESNYDLNGRPCRSNEDAMMNGPKKIKQKQKNGHKRRMNKKVEDAIGRLYGRSRRTSLAIIQTRSKENQESKTEDEMNIHEMPKGVEKISSKKEVTNGRLTKRAKTNKTVLKKKDRKKSTIQPKEEHPLANDDSNDTGIKAGLPDVDG